MEEASTILPERRVSAEVARSSLIAISQSAPEEISKVAGEMKNSGVGEEECRTKLISISYSGPGAGKAAPQSPGKFRP